MGRNFRSSGGGAGAEQDPRGSDSPAQRSSENIYQADRGRCIQSSRFCDNHTHGHRYTETGVDTGGEFAGSQGKCNGRPGQENYASAVSDQHGDSACKRNSTHDARSYGNSNSIGARDHPAAGRQATFLCHALQCGVAGQFCNDIAFKSHRRLPGSGSIRTAIWKTPSPARHAGCDTGRRRLTFAEPDRFFIRRAFSRAAPAKFHSGCNAAGGGVAFPECDGFCVCCAVSCTTPDESDSG